MNILCEDRTGTGLARVIKAAVNGARGASRALEFPRKPGTVLNNARLLETCARYENYRFRSRPRWDHVVYVIDAYRLWDLREVSCSPPNPNEGGDALIGRLTDAAVNAMTRRARGTRSDEEWERIAGGFHPHVLVWERESLILPVADALGLGQPPDEPITVRHPARWVKGRMREAGQGSYEKSVHGPELLERIAYDPGLLETVLAATPSLRAIVDALVAL